MEEETKGLKKGGAAAAAYYTLRRRPSELSGLDSFRWDA